jgi:hypothetical protein
VNNLSALASIVLAVVLFGCGGDEPAAPAPPDDAPTSKLSSGPDLNAEVRAENAPPGSNQRAIARFARAWAKDFAVGDRLTCVFMAGTELKRCRATYTTAHLRRYSSRSSAQSRSGSAPLQRRTRRA